MTKPLVLAALLIAASHLAPAQTKIVWTDKKALAQESETYIKAAFKKASIPQPTFIRHVLTCEDGKIITYSVDIKHMPYRLLKKYYEGYIADRKAKRNVILFGRTTLAVSMSESGQKFNTINFEFPAQGEDISSIPNKPSYSRPKREPQP